MTSISTLSFNTQTRTSLMRLQGEVNDLTLQMNNDGRHLDVGRTLGRLTGSSVSAQSLSDSVGEQQTSNGIIDRRLKTVEAAMTTMKSGAEDFANQMLGGSSSLDLGTMVNLAKNGRSQMVNNLNLTDAGSYIFGGIQTEKPPIDAATVDQSTSVAAAHFAAFVTAANLDAGRSVIPAGKTAASLVTAAEMKAYLSGGFTVPAVPVVGVTPVTYKFSEVFNGLTPGTTAADPVANPALTAAYSNWGDNWSQASSDKGQSRISGTETAVTYASANDAAYRQMASGYAMITDLGLADLSAETRALVMTTASATLKTATTAVTSLGAEVGATRKRIDTANTELKRQQDLLDNTVTALEYDDVTEIGVRVNALSTQLQAAYAVTGKIQKLSLLDYL